MSARSPYARFMPYGVGAFLILVVIWLAVPSIQRSNFPTPKSSNTATGEHDDNLQDIRNATLGVSA